MTEQFWLDTRIPISNDLSDWRELDEDHKWVVGHVFGGLTLLDTLQSQDGMAALRKDIRTPHETAVLNNIQFMESVHAKSYSSIFETLNTPLKLMKFLLGVIQKNSFKIKLNESMSYIMMMNIL